MTNACEPFFESIGTYLTALETGIEQLLEISGSQDAGAFGASEFAIGFSNVCQGNCPAYICGTFLAGLGYASSDLDWAGTGTEDETDFSEEKKKREEKLPPAKMLINYIKNRVGKQLEKHINKVQEPVRMLRKVNNDKKSMSLKSTGTVTNNYTTDGYPAYTNGQNSGLNTSISAGSSLFNWISYLLF